MRNSLKAARLCVRTLASCVCWLAGGVDPSQWIGAEQFKNEELEVIRGMIQKKRSRSPVERASTIPKPRFPS